MEGRKLLHHHIEECAFFIPPFPSGCAQEVLLMFKSRQGTPGFSLRNLFILACFLSTKHPEPGQEKAQTPSNVGSRLASLCRPWGTWNLRTQAQCLWLWLPLVFIIEKQFICDVPGPWEAHTYKCGIPTVRLLRYDFGTNWRAIIKTGRATWLYRPLIILGLLSWDVHF